MAQSTYETSSNGKLQNDFIEFTNDIKLLTNHIIVKNIYVRESYKTITALMADKMIKEGVRRFVVTGTPGIGKTVFLHYFLWVLFTRQTSINNNVERKIYLQAEYGRIYSFQGNKTVSIDAGVAEETVLYDSNCILLAYMVIENEPARCSGTTIVFSSPNPKRYKQFVNRMATRFILNCWTLEELKVVWSHSYQHIAWKDVKRIYNKMGGVFRYVLQQHNDVADERMEEGISRCREKLIDWSKSLDYHISYGIDGPLMYRAIHIYSPVITNMYLHLIMLVKSV